MDKARIEATVIKDAKAEGKAEGLAEREARGKAGAKAELIQAMQANGMAPEQIAAITKSIFQSRYEPEADSGWRYGLRRLIG